MYVVRERNLNPTHRYKFFVWLVIMNRSADGLIETPELVT
jgi:hypothetical protein